MIDIICYLYGFIVKLILVMTSKLFTYKDTEICNMFASFFSLVYRTTSTMPPEYNLTQPALSIFLCALDIRGGTKIGFIGLV